MEGYIIIVIVFGLSYFFIGLVYSRAKKEKWEDEKTENQEMMKAGAWIFLAGIMLLIYNGWDWGYFAQ